MLRHEKPEQEKCRRGEMRHLMGLLGCVRWFCRCLQPLPVPPAAASASQTPSSPSRGPRIRACFPPPCSVIPGLLGPSLRAAGGTLQPQTGQSELLALESPKPCVREGKHTQRRGDRRFVSSHLISSFAMFRGRFNFLGSGRRLRPQRWQRPNAQGCPRRSRLSSHRSRGPQRGGTGTRAAPGALAADPAGPRGRGSETRRSSCPRPVGSG